MMQMTTTLRETTDAMVRRMLRDEEGFLRRASARELTQAVLYFRAMASKAMTPQARDFYIDRANQFSIRALSGGAFGHVVNSGGKVFRH
jgi:hypothetical protein